MNSNQKKEECCFCSLPVNRILLENTFYMIVRDKYPVSEGHTLIIPKRHIQSFFELNTSEFLELHALFRRLKIDLDRELKPNGYNIGINDGEFAGQTIHHLHIHLIPRYKGDIKEPRGGVRWIFPDKADYWS